MLTSAQRDVFLELVDSSPTQVRKPRIVQATSGFDDPGFGDGTILLVGRDLEEDHPLTDCDCDQDHVIYILVREDGMSSPTVTAGTFGEMLEVPPEGYWSEAREVEADEWPVEFSLDGLDRL